MKSHLLLVSFHEVHFHLINYYYYFLKIFLVLNRHK